MPMIDVYSASGTFGDPHALAQALATELMAIEQVPDIPMFRKNTAAFVHEMPSASLSNVDGDSTYVRVQVLTNAALSIATSSSQSSAGSRGSSPMRRVIHRSPTAPGSSSPRHPMAGGASRGTRTRMGSSSLPLARRSRNSRRRRRTTER